MTYQSVRLLSKCQACNFTLLCLSAVQTGRARVGLGLGLGLGLQKAVIWTAVLLCSSPQLQAAVLKTGPPAALFMRQSRRNYHQPSAAGANLADSMWKQLLGAEGGERMQQLRARLGQRVLVVSNEKSSSSGSRREYPQASVAMSDREAEIARRTWFELQKFGKQAIFLTTPLTPFPTERAINDALTFCQRIPGGVTGIIAIGTGVTADVSKAVRALAERGLSSVAAYDAAELTLPNQKKSDNHDKKRDIPLVNVVTTISPVPFCASWLCLHKEEDALSRRRAQPADLVVFDDEIILAPDNVKFTNFPECTRAYLLVNIYDCLFAMTMRAVGDSSPGADAGVVETVRGVAEAAIAAAGGASSLHGNSGALRELCLAIGEMRNDVEGHCASREQSPPYILDVATYVKGASLLSANSFSAPYSLVAACTLLPSLRLIAERDASNVAKGKYVEGYRKSADLTVDKAAYLALRALQQLLGFSSVAALLSSIAGDASRVDDVLTSYIANSSVDVRARTINGDGGAVGAASILEGLIMAEDSSAERALGGAIFAPQTSAPPSAVVARGDVLKSDLILTICEDFFHQP